VVREAAAELQAVNQFNDPRGVYARLPFDVRLK
jgi:hypothetical protein